jgi:hypothetical protein
VVCNASMDEERKGCAVELGIAARFESGKAENLGYYRHPFHGLLRQPAPSGQAGHLREAWRVAQHNLRMHLRRKAQVLVRSGQALRQQAAGSQEPGAAAAGRASTSLRCAGSPTAAAALKHATPAALT